MSEQGDEAGLDLMRVVINLAGLGLAAATVALIVATIITGID